MPDFKKGDYAKITTENSGVVRVTKVLKFRGSGFVMVRFLKGDRRPFPVHTANLRLVELDND